MVVISFLYLFILLGVVQQSLKNPESMLFFSKVLTFGAFQPEGW
jgi:hypothetical protein